MHVVAACVCAPMYARVHTNPPDPPENPISMELLLPSIPHVLPRPKLSPAQGAVLVLKLEHRVCFGCIVRNKDGTSEDFKP